MKQENVAANSVRHDNIGISLISLIITIIVIIILAAIVIFSGLNTPDSASFAGFTQQVDNVYQAVMNKYGDLKAKHAIAGHYRTDEQIYIEIAVADDPDQYATMGTTSVTNFKSGTEIEASTGIQNIQVGAAMNKEHSIGMTLPKVRENNTAWYVTKEGKVFNANGYIYDGKTYFSGSLYQGNELPANETSNSNRAYYIYEAIKKDINLVEGAPLEGTGDVITGGSTNDNNGGNETPGTTSYTVTFNSNGGTINSGNITQYTVGTGATLPTDVTKSNSTFGGWYDNEGLTGNAVTTISTTDTGNKEYWAKWNAVVATTYSVGDTITRTIDGTNYYFYVIEDSGASSTTVKAITKERITTALVQDPSAAGQNFCTSDVNQYWYDPTANNVKSQYGTSYDTSNLEETSEIASTDGKTAMYYAQEYGKIVPGAQKGRLMTYQEATALQSSTKGKQILYYQGDYATTGSNKIYWLGSASSSSYLWYARPSSSNLVSDNRSSVFGVRPVIIFLKSSL